MSYFGYDKNILDLEIDRLIKDNTSDKYLQDETWNFYKKYKDVLTDVAIKKNVTIIVTSKHATTILRLVEGLIEKCNIKSISEIILPLSQMNEDKKENIRIIKNFLLEKNIEEKYNLKEIVDKLITIEDVDKLNRITHYLLTIKKINVTDRLEIVDILLRASNSAISSIAEKISLEHMNDYENINEVKEITCVLAESIGTKQAEYAYYVVNLKMNFNLKIALIRIMANLEQADLSMFLYYFINKIRYYEISDELIIECVKMMANSRGISQFKCAEDMLFKGILKMIDFENVCKLAEIISKSSGKLQAELAYDVAINLIGNVTLEQLYLLVNMISVASDIQIKYITMINKMYDFIGINNVIKYINVISKLDNEEDIIKEFLIIIKEYISIINSLNNTKMVENIVEVNHILIDDLMNTYHKLSK